MQSTTKRPEPSEKPALPKSAPEPVQPNTVDSEIKHTPTLPESPVTANLNKHLSPQDRVEQQAYLDEFARTHNLGKLANSYNETAAPEYTRNIYTAVEPTYEAVALNVGFRTAVSNLDHIAEAFNVVLKKDDELVSHWESAVHKYDAIIKSLYDTKWKKIIGYSTGVVIVCTFLWKMGALRAIPNFAGSLIQLIPKPNFDPAALKETPQPQLEDTLHHVMQTPLTPLALVSGIGLLSLGYGMLKFAAWVFRKAPK